MSKTTDMRGGAHAPARIVPVRAGFTLFEVGLSLIIVSFAIVSVMLLFPVGIRTQTMARYQIYASAKALEMVDAYTGFHTCNPASEMEALQPWDVPSSYCTLAPDLEQRLCSYRFGVMPLPTQLASRLDSDNGEIQQILSEGGSIYYSQPLATTGFKDSAIPDSPPNEAQRLVFAVTGYAQQNAIPYLPQKAWPYYDPWPSPPSHYNSHVDLGPDHGMKFDPSQVGFTWPTNKTPAGPGGNQQQGKDGVMWDDTNGPTGDPDPDLQKVWFWDNDKTKPDPADYSKMPQDLGNKDLFGYRQHWYIGTLPSAKRYLQSAIYYCQQKGFNVSDYDKVIDDTTDPYKIFKNTQSKPDDRYKEVQVVRFLAHAAACVTTYVSQADLAAGLLVETATIDSTVVPDYKLTEDGVIKLHDNAMKMAMLFAASYPYDWGAPRPLNRPIMMDHPLMEYDMSASVMGGPDYQKGKIGGSGPNAYQWKVATPQKIRNFGRNASFANVKIDPSTFISNQSALDFNLTTKFDPAERCRQIVFWAVDWQSYEDFETLPSAPVDAGKYPKKGGASYASGGNGYSNTLVFMDWQQFGYRNPEKVIAFVNPVTLMPTGTDLTTADNGGDIRNLSQGLGQNGGNGDEGITTKSFTDAGGKVHTVDPKHVFLGMYGADRNFNGKLDRGTVPKSQRLRAVTVARFNYYDLRVNASMR